MPLEVRVLEKRIKNWKKFSGAVAIYPLDAGFSEMYISYTPILLDSKTEFSAICDIFSPEDMYERYRPLYQRLKKLECQLCWSGLLRSKPKFEVSSSLRNLKRHMPDLSLDNTLIEALSSNADLMKDLKKIKPSLDVSLWSAKVKAGASLSTEDLINVLTDLPRKPLDVIADFYENPDRITWIARLTSMVPPDFSCDRRINTIFDTLDIVCRTAKRVSVSLMREVV